ncbi:MAG TPA: efflux transporter outer membrane subunit [Polyangiaceae bacterium]|nr:efflux transporter outer membrane subunit [Polyangiaceae bacterium]
MHTTRRSDRFGAAALLGVVFTLAGCSVGPNFSKRDATVPVSKTWRQRDPRIATQAAAESKWWKGFNDPALDRLIELAYAQNLPLQIAGLRIVEARAQLAVAVGAQYPQQQQFSGRALAVQLSQGQPNVIGFDRNFFDYQLGFDANWELDLWGKFRRGVEAESANLLASVADYHSALVSLTAEVARTYAVVRTFEVLIEQARENARLQEEGLRIADARFRNGATSELDVAQATTLLESTRASIPELEVSLHQARNALSTLVGQRAGAVDTLLVGPKQIPTAPPTVAVSVPAEMLRRRPDIRSAELLAAAQCARIGIAKAELYPSFSLFGTVGLRASNSGGDARNLFSSDSLYYAVGPQLNWPFLNYGRLKNNVRVQDARFQQLLVNYRNTVLQAAQEVEDALSGFVNAHESSMFNERSVQAARRASELAMIEYQEGAVDYQRVLDAQRFLLQQENNLARARSSIAINLVAVYKALGGGWELRQGQPIVPERIQQEMKERTDWGDLVNEPSSPETKQKLPRGRP